MSLYIFYDTGYVYSEKPFISWIVLSLMDILGLNVAGIEDYRLFNDRYYRGVQMAQELENRK
jgi:hypothetical protein